jgi:hypothetical protein
MQTFVLDVTSILKKIYNIEILCAGFMVSVVNHKLELGAFLAKYPWSPPKPRKGRSCSTFNLIRAEYICHEAVDVCRSIFAICQLN